MVWTSPMTWTDGSVLTAAQLNLHLRDNLLETIVAKTTASSTMCVVDQNNKIVERNPGADSVTAQELCESDEYGDLDTVGPTVKRVTGPTCFVAFRAEMRSVSGTSGIRAFTALEVSRTNSEVNSEEEGDEGDNVTWEASDVICATNRFNGTAVQVCHMSSFMIWHDLGLDDATDATGIDEAFEYQFTLKYRATGGDANISNRHLFVWPLS